MPETATKTMFAAGHIPLECKRCDEDGYVERDRSYGDYTLAVRENCPDCDGTKQLKCCECDAFAVERDVDGEPVCLQHKRGAK